MCRSLRRVRKTFTMRLFVTVKQSSTRGMGAGTWWPAKKRGLDQEEMQAGRGRQAASSKRLWPESVATE